MRISRSRGAVSGVLLIILGLWGGLIPFVGPYFDFTIGSNTAWDYTDARLWLSILPAVAVVLGGLVLLGSAHRLRGGIGAWLAVVGGIWFVVGEQFSQLWNHGTSQAGDALGGTGKRVLEQLAFFDGLGALITAIAAFALGRLAVRSARDAELAREAELTPGRDAAADADGMGPRRTRESGRFDRDPEPSAAGAGAEPADRADPAPTDRPDNTISAADRVREAANDDQDDTGKGGGSRRR